MVALPDSDLQMYFRIVHGDAGKDATVDILHYNTREKRWDVTRIEVKETDTDFWNMSD